MSTNERTRFAPTPSGFLHLGNAFNFLLIHKLAKKKNADILLRIDDLDTARSRDEYLEDIFETLEWLGLNYHEGPQGVDDFKKNHSQSLKKEHYRQALSKLEGIFTCTCSRSDIKKLSPEGIYPGTCREDQLRFIEGETSLRYTYDVENPLRDFVIWRKDDLPSYQLVSSIEDLEKDITFVVRGFDLKDSTIAQKHLLSRLAPDKKNISFLHHPLLSDENGGKLSKSEGALSIREMKKSDPSPTPIYERFEKWYESIKDSIQ